MRIYSLFFVAVWVATCGALVSRAQSELPPKELPERLPTPAAEAVVPALPSVPGVPGDMCHGVKILWLEHQLPVQVLAPREVITPEQRRTTAVVYRDEKRVVTDLVLKPHEVLREVPCTIMQPCTVTDPHTGHCSTVMKPCTVMKTQKETVFYPVVKEREILIKVPYLKEVQEVVPRRTLLLEYRTDLVRVGVPLPIPYETPKPQVMMVPQTCPHPHHP